MKSQQELFYISAYSHRVQRPLQEERRNFSTPHT